MDVVIMSSRKRYFILGCILAAVIGTIWLLSIIFGGSNQRDISVVSKPLPLPSSTVIAPLANSSSFVFSNGRYFVKYDYLSGSSTRLSPDEALPTINKIVPSGDGEYVAFQSSKHGFQDALGKQLLSENLSPDTSYWWILDVTAQKFTRIEGSPVVVHWKDSSHDLYTLSDSGEGGIITHYALPGQNQLPSFAVEGSRDFFPVSDGYIIETNSNSLIKLSMDGQTSKVIFEGYKSIAFSSLESWASATNITASENETAHIYLLQLETGDKTELSDSHEGTGVWLPQGREVCYPSEKEKTLQCFDTTTKARKNYFYEKEQAVDEKLIAVMAENTFIMSDGSSNQVVSDRKLMEFLTVDNYNKSLGSDASLIYYPSEMSFIVSYLETNQPTIREQVYDTLRKDGINPDLATIQFNSITLRQQ